jgi:hypothetical protein
MLQMLKLQNEALQKVTKYSHKIHQTDCTFFLIEIWYEDYNIFIQKMQNSKVKQK